MRRIALHLAAITFLIAAPLSPAHGQAYQVTNLVSDGSVSAITTDPGFQNPWAISASGTWWISTANTGSNYVVSSASDAIAFKVVIPAASGTGNGTPTGSVTTGGASGMILSNGTKASFLFATLDGAIDGWNNKLGTAGAVVLNAINNSAAGASYPGLAILNVNATTSYILAPNFGAGNKIEVYDSTFKPTQLANSFTDPNLPSNYGPFSIHVLNNQVWVAYAQHPTAAPFIPVTGLGNGIVDVFDNTGKLVSRAVTGGNLNAPWGVAFAPSTGFGIFSGDLLIGNFGDGMINVYDPKTFAYLGQLMDSTGKSLQYPSLWELLTGGTAVGNSSTPSGGLVTDVYFTSGLVNEQHGLFAAISNGTVSGASPAFDFTIAAGATTVLAGSAATATLSVAPVNGFNGAVTFACSGLPVGATCIFSPASLNVASNLPATEQLLISTSPKMMASARPLHFGKTRSALALASLVPFSLLAFLRRRRGSPRILRVFGPLAILLLGLGTSVLVLGCSNGPAATPATPSGSSTVTVTATSGSISQKSTVAMTVQ